MVIFGIINIYSSSYSDSFTSIFDYTTLVGKQLIFLVACIVSFITIIFSNNKFFDNIALLLYITSILLLISLFLFGVESGGATSW